MHDFSDDRDRLDELLGATGFAEPPGDFSAGVMARVKAAGQEHSPGLSAWLQWLGVGLGAALTVVRLLGFIFSAWLALDAAG